MRLYQLVQQLSIHLVLFQFLYPYGLAHIGIVAGGGLGDEHCQHFLERLLFLGGELVVETVGILGNGSLQAAYLPVGAERERVVGIPLLVQLRQGKLYQRQVVYGHCIVGNEVVQSFALVRHLPFEASLSGRLFYNLLYVGATGYRHIHHHAVLFYPTQILVAGKQVVEVVAHG